MAHIYPDHNCSLCPRLVTYREQNKKTFPDQHNGAVPSFGQLDASILIVGLAPGLKGANFTGRPFTGDYAGDVLYSGLKKIGLAIGDNKKHKDDGLKLIDCRITNAVRCVPPQNKPTPIEENNCRFFLEKEIAAMTNLKKILALGSISHKAIIRVFGKKQVDHAFSHGAIHPLSNDIRLIDSYHCSRYNINTKRLTEEMFDDVLNKLLTI